MREPIDTLQRFLHQVENFGETEPSNAGASVRGPTLLVHRLVEIMPRFSSKRQVVEISQQIENDISAYLVTIAIMNAAVGIAVALTMWLTGVGDPILWGTVAFLLNYYMYRSSALRWAF